MCLYDCVYMCLCVCVFVCLSMCSCACFSPRDCAHGCVSVLFDVECCVVCLLVRPHVCDCVCCVCLCIWLYVRLIVGVCV